MVFMADMRLSSVKPVADWPQQRPVSSVKPLLLLSARNAPALVNWKKDSQYVRPEALYCLWVRLFLHFEFAETIVLGPRFMTKPRAGRDDMPHDWCILAHSGASHSGGQQVAMSCPPSK